MTPANPPKAPITFIYFDVGGVVIDDFSDNSKWDELRAGLGITAANRAAFEQLWERYVPEMVTNRDSETLLPILRSQLGLNIPANYSLLHAFTDRFQANPPIWPAIEAARQKARVGLLTNMYPGMFAAIQARGILPAGEWDAVVDSSIENLAKPNHRFFALAEERANAQSHDDARGQQLLFVDNSRSHVSAAQEFGWQGYWYDSSDHTASSHQLRAFIDKLR